ncbi:MAG: pilin [Patescibacteria group bacterium]|jgi:hypothetical protein
MKHILIKQILISLSCVLAIVIPGTVAAGYTPQDIVFDPNGNVEKNTGLGNATPVTIAARIINWILTLLAIIAVSLIVYAGYLWMMFGGNEEEVGKAREILKGALFGLVTILSSYGITNYVFEHLVNVTTK